MTTESDNLKIRLKTWEHGFIDKNQRAPTKDDIKKLPEVKLMYKQYSSLKKGKPITKEAKLNHVKDVKATEEIMRSPQVKATQAAEFGPTPQIYGKTMSLFDMEISPIKPPTITIEMRTPEKESPVSTIPQRSSPVHMEEFSVKRQLQFNSTPISSPMKTIKPTSILEPSNPKYYGPNSPLKLGDQNLQIKIRRTPLRQSRFYKPNKDSVSSFSPSPIIKRPLSKSLLELAREHEAIVEEFSRLEEYDDVEEEEEEVISKFQVRDIFGEEDNKVNSKFNNIKVKKRRIMRRFDGQKTTNSIPLDIHKELLKLKRKQVNEFLGTSSLDNEGSETSQEESESTETSVNTLQKKKRPKKYNLVSNNFRRLKLPRKNRFNSRFGGRRR